MVEILYSNYLNKKNAYEKIEQYYIGQTDAILNYTTTDRSNSKVSVNYIKKFVKEETAYSVGNPITFSCKREEDREMLYWIDKTNDNFRENHDINTFSAAVLFGVAYEVAYIDKFGNFQVKGLKPTEAYAETDENGDIEYFIHVYKKREIVDNQEVFVDYIDYYTDTNIQVYRYTEKIELVNVIPHYFGEIPVGIARVSEYIENDTLFADIKTLQDAIETNLSDVVNEISDFRNAYLVLNGLTLDDSEAEKFKKNGIIEIPDSSGSAEWLIKNINDTFVQNTLATLQEKIYEMTSHINHNDAKLMANASGIALKSRLIALMQRCKINEGAYKDLVKIRIRLMFKYLAIKHSKVYDANDINIKFTPLIPSDDSSTAEMLRTLDGKLSLETGLGLLSFVEDGRAEVARLQHEGNRKTAIAEVQADLRSHQSYIEEFSQAPNGEFEKILEEKSKLEGSSIGEFETVNTVKEDEINE